MANGTITVTIGANEWKYVDISGVEHTVTTGQTFTMASTDDGSGATYKPTAGASVSTTDGHRIYFTPYFPLTIAGDTAVSDSNILGNIELLFTGTGEVSQWKCTGFDADDADALEDITAARFERVDNPMYSFTWANIATAFA